MPDGLLDVSPSPLWGGVRGGGNPDGQCSAIPPSLSLPHKGGGDADPAGLVWRDGAFRRDAWVKADADVPLREGPVIVSKKRWLAERGQLALDAGREAEPLPRPAQGRRAGRAHLRAAFEQTQIRQCDRGHVSLPLLDRSLGPIRFTASRSTGTGNP